MDATGVFLFLAGVLLIVALAWDNRTHHDIWRDDE